jgi:two-component system KDP operon response regulator KdpE
VTALLLVEDDAPLRGALRATLQTGRFSVLEAPSGEDALALVASKRPDLVILDLNLPGIDGLETLRHLRVLSNVPVIVLTVRDDLRNKLSALDAGADDYLVKPFEPDELLARTRAHLRRAGASEERPATVTAGSLRIDIVRREVTWDGDRVSLTPTEYRLLEVFVANQGRLLSREELLEQVWGPERSADHVRLRVTLVSLRRKLHDDAANPRLIFTEPGLGYRWIGEGDRGDGDR